jgi:hypothetical protein
MANKQYKDFTAGAFAADQIIAQQSTSDDSYTKVPVPTFGLGDAVASEDRLFEFDAHSLDLNATTSTSGESSSALNLSNTGSFLQVTDFDSGDFSYFSDSWSVSEILSANAAVDLYTDAYLTKATVNVSINDSITPKSNSLVMLSGSTTSILSDSSLSALSAISQSASEIIVEHDDASSYVKQHTQNNSLVQQVQDDQVSPTQQSAISITQTDITIASLDVPTPNEGSVTISKTQFEARVTDGTDVNYFHADKENMSLVGTAGVPFDFYNSENRLYMSLHLINFGGLGNYATNAAAITAGLQVGDIYRTAGVLMIVI